jgi:RNA polymerase sigma-70 factor (ECF subfamily)
MGAGMGASPEELLRQARAGDPAALGHVLDGCRNNLLLLAQAQIGRRLQGKVDAADVVQDVYLAAHRHFGGFRGESEGELLVWLREILGTTLCNLVRHYYGTQRRDVRLERELAAELDRSSQVLGAGLAADDSSPSQRASRREQGVLLADALGRLPADYREVLVLRHLEGLPFPDVARRLGRGVDATKKLWARALDRLRRVLEAPHE